MQLGKISEFQFLGNFTVIFTYPKAKEKTNYCVCVVFSTVSFHLKYTFSRSETEKEVHLSEYCKLALKLEKRSIAKTHLEPLQNGFSIFILDFLENRKNYYPNSIHSLIDLQLYLECLSIKMNFVADLEGRWR